MNLTAHRGEIIHFTRKLSATQLAPEYEHFGDGLLIINQGKVVDVGDANILLTQYSGSLQIIEHPNCVITPGFVDTHVHYPQMSVIASYGTQLLDWLEKYTFPAELKFFDPDFAAQAADFFLNQLIANGTTTAQVFGTVHPASVDAFFEAANGRNLRMICGKVMMDRNAPKMLLDTPESSYQESKALIDKWHENKRLRYAVTPRFAPTSSPEQLAKAGQLLQEYPGVHLHTHLAENIQECDWVASLFPNQKSYLDVYDHFGLLGNRSVFAHGVHLDHSACCRLAQTQSAIAHCPASNLFIGSGLFNLKQALLAGVKISLASDIGGGDALNMLGVINQAYKMQQLQNYSLNPIMALYLATLGGAVALDMDDHIGNFGVGKEADFIVLDYHATAILEQKINCCQSFEERLFSILMLGDDRAIKHCYILGQEAKATL